MSDKPIPTLPSGVLSDEQLQRISGGDCTIADIQRALDELKNSYESLIDFTSYVIERVAGP